MRVIAFVVFRRPPGLQLAKQGSNHDRERGQTLLTIDHLVEILVILVPAQDERAHVVCRGCSVVRDDVPPQIVPLRLGPRVAALIDGNLIALPGR